MENEKLNDFINKTYDVVMALSELLCVKDNNEQAEETAAADADDPAELIPKNTSDCDECPYFVWLTKKFNPKLKCKYCDESEGCTEDPKECGFTVGYCGYLDVIGVSLGSGIAEGEKICGIGEEEWQGK